MVLFKKKNLNKVLNNKNCITPFVFKNIYVNLTLATLKISFG